MEIKMTININGKEIELADDEMRQLYYRLHLMYGKTNYEPYYPVYPVYPWDVRPYQPWTVKYSDSAGNI